MGMGVSFHFFTGAIAVFASLTGLGNRAWAIEAQDFQTLLTVTTDAEKNLKCTLQVAIDSSTSEARGLQIDCGAPDPSHKFFTLEQLRQGVPLVHKDDKNIDVITLTIADFDPIHGGTVKLHYLSSYLSKSYGDWFAQVVGDGGRWIPYTSPDNGHRAFNALFAAKRTFLGKAVGIKEFRASWVAGSSSGD